MDIYADFDPEQENDNFLRYVAIALHFWSDAAPRRLKEKWEFLEMSSRLQPN
jgi:hypothetical protein